VKALLTRLGLKGRSTRTALLGYFVFSALASVVLWFVVLARMRDSAESGGSPSIGLLPLWVVYLQIAFALAWLWLSIRRFHDQDRPGWLALIAPALYAFSALVFTLPYVAELLPLALLVGLLLPPTIGPNRYGPDPRGWKSREHWLEHHRAQRGSP
jgi:uncharacterized membrane protein YhaH (DUF805 family)